MNAIMKWVEESLALYLWRRHWIAVWFHLGRAVTLSAASQPVNDRGKIYAREAFLLLTGARR